MSNAALDRMPQEVLADICWYLCSHCTNDQFSHYPDSNSLATVAACKLWGKPSVEDTTGLLSLARTCRVLNKVATPYIYHNIDARGRSEEKITEFLRDRHRRLEERSFVRRLTYELNPFPLYTLLCRMPGLQLLSLVDSQHSYCRALAIKTQKRLDSLRYLHLKSTDTVSTCDLRTLVNLFEMAPNIKTLVIESDILLWTVNPQDPPKVPLANLTCLKLLYISVSENVLRGVLERCGPLESFIYIAYRSTRDWVSPSILPYALRKCRSTLRHLECYWHSKNHGPSALHSFRNFNKLKTLALGGKSLSIGISCTDDATNITEVETLDPTSLVELLPPSIVEVRIDSKQLHEGMYRPMVALGQAKQAGSFPELRSFLQSNFDVSKVPYTLDNLRELSERYKISFQQEAVTTFPLPKVVFQWMVRQRVDTSAIPTDTDEDSSW